MMPTEEDDFLHKILPPRLEDAGLEDCALPPDAIKEAFLRAATAVRSIISLSDHEDEDEDDDDCLNDPWPTTKDSSDILLGIDEGAESPDQSSCSVVKGGDSEGGDKVAVIGVDDEEKENAEDVVVVGVVEEGGACVDGMRGLKIGEKGVGNKEKRLKGKNHGGGDEEEEDEKEKPILAQGFV